MIAGVAWGGSFVAAQTTPGGGSPAPAGMSKKTFTKNTTFNLPIQMDERTRASLREVQLYVKSGSGDWVRQEVVTPQTSHFTYRVPQDGEYWFSLVTVDRAGKAAPNDINAVPPALRVVVDTRAPVLEAAVAADGSEPVLRVNVVDANPDQQSVRALVGNEHGDRALSPVAGQLATFKLTAVDLNQTIRITASDLSGNLTTREITGRELMAASGVAFPSSGTPTVAGAPTQASATPPAMNPIAPTQVAPMVTANNIAAPPTALPTLPSNPITPPPTTPAQSNVTATSYRPASIDVGDRPTNRKIINTTHASIDYRIDTVGPSGIGRVDVYLTPDRGQNWTKVAEDIDKRSPADLDLPGEGLFGIRLAITNGNGFGGRAPKAGDRPSFFIEVDATSPFVQLQPIDMVPGSGAIDIRWTANDTNIAAEPVSLFFRTRTDGTWQPIARNVKNDGVYRWAFPRDIGQQFYLKLEVADLAGNVTRVETPTPILLDLTEPVATLVDVTPAQQRGGVSSGTTVTPAPIMMPAPPSLVPER